VHPERAVILRRSLVPSWRSLAWKALRVSSGIRHERSLTHGNWSYRPGPCLKPRAPAPDVLSRQGRRRRGDRPWQPAARGL